MQSSITRTTRRTGALVRLGLLALGSATLVACGGSGGADGNGGSGGTGISGFQLLNVSGMPGGTTNSWKINRPIDFVFNTAVDFDSINSSSIQIRNAQGQQALGEFIEQPGSTVIRFQPRCPTEPDLSDAGLAVGETYSIVILGSDGGGGIAVRSAGGSPLSSSQQRTFVTPASTSPEEIFFDAVPSPPRVLVAQPLPGAPAATNLSRIELGNGSVEPFVLVGTVPTEIDDLPLNLYSGGDDRFSVILEFDQPVNPSLTNISSDRLKLQFDRNMNGIWEDVPTNVTLVENCTDLGARVRLDAVGILPKDALLRVEIDASFEDIVGSQSALSVNDFARFRTNTGTAIPAFASQPLVDEFLEDFDSTTFRDDDFLLDLPEADWSGGRLTASFEFPTRPNFSPGFDLILEPDELIVVNTSNGTITNDSPGGIGIDDQQLITDGVIYLNDLEVKAGATLRFVGPNPVEIWATGDVTVRGTIECRGDNAADQDSLSSVAAILGVGGNGGGGRGGTASPSNLIEPDPKGGDGFGPFDQPGIGGRGGESGYGNTLPGDTRRAGGGGGGRTTDDFLGSLSNTQGANALEGNDGTTIVNGQPNTGALGAITGSSPPQGGQPGDSVLQNNITNDNFWGVRRGGPVGAGPEIVGEFSTPQPGSGGGAGGDSIKNQNYPGNFTQSKNMRAASGAGGGGLLRISCLGLFFVGQSGLIDVSGGIGGRGERRAGFDSGGVAGGSGGGSAGTMILEASGGFDLRGNGANVLFRALGGLGGGGENNTTGTTGTFNSGDAGGGNGGAGVIQLHVFDDNPNVDGWSLLNIGTATNINSFGVPTPLVCFPTFGARSRVVSRAVPLGGATLNVSPSLPTGRLRYGFSELPSLNAGVIPSSGGDVDDESPVITATTPAVVVNDTTNVVTLRFAQSVADDVTRNMYMRNTQLLRQQGLRLSDGGANVDEFTIASGTFNYGASSSLTLTLEGSPDLSDYVAGTITGELIPRFYRVESDGTDDVMPDTASIAIEFQGLSADANGNPDLVNAPAVDWTSDPADMANFNNAGGDPIDFFRFRVTFNNDADAMVGLTGSEVLPSLDFLRLFFEF